MERESDFQLTLPVRELVKSESEPGAGQRPVFQMASPEIREAVCLPHQAIC
jgi:hypothetical protein